jgi:hypothetical protein
MAPAPAGSWPPAVTIAWETHPPAIVLPLERGASRTSPDSPNQGRQPAGSAAGGESVAPRLQRLRMRFPSNA